MSQPSFLLKVLLIISSTTFAEKGYCHDTAAINRIDLLVSNIESSINKTQSVKRIGVSKGHYDPDFSHDYYIIDTSEKKLLKVINKEINEYKVQGHKRRNDTTSYYYMQRDTLVYSFYFLDEELIKVLVESGVTRSEYYFKESICIYKILIAHNKTYPMISETESEIFSKKAKKFIDYYIAF